jgi:hypothetical protein
MSTIPFDDIVPGATVRSTTIDAVQYLSISDIIKHICAKDFRGASKIWRNLSDEKKKKLTDTNKGKTQLKHQFPGQGQTRVAVISIEGAMKLIMVLPGKRANAMRLQAADILTRYIHGDTDNSLLQEIKHNRQIGPVAACTKLAQKAAANASQYTEMPQVSYVYGTKSEAFPDLIKIGRSADVTARLTSLNTACAPAPHFIVAVAPTFNAPRDESLAHAFFASTRREGEFFQVTPEEVKAFFSNHIMIQYQVELAEHIAKTQGDCF